MVTLWCALLHGRIRALGTCTAVGWAGWVSAWRLEFSAWRFSLSLLLPSRSLAADEPALRYLSGTVSARWITLTLWFTTLRSIFDHAMRHGEQALYLVYLDRIITASKGHWLLNEEKISNIRWRDGGFLFNGFWDVYLLFAFIIYLLRILSNSSLRCIFGKARIEHEWQTIQIF